jgi:hypothetical protein
MGEYLKSPLDDQNPIPLRKAEVEYPFYNKSSLNKDMERFVKEATPRKIFSDKKASGAGNVNLPIVYKNKESPNNSFFSDLLSDPVSNQKLSEIIKVLY